MVNKIEGVGSAAKGNNSVLCDLDITISNYGSSRVSIQLIESVNSQRVSIPRMFSKSSSDCVELILGVTLGGEGPTEE